MFVVGRPFDCVQENGGKEASVRPRLGNSAECGALLVSVFGKQEGGSCLELRLFLSKTLLKASRSAPGENKIKTNTKFLFKLLALQRDREISDGLSPIFPYWLGIASSCSGYGK